MPKHSLPAQYLSFEQYLQLTQRFAETGKSSGAEQSEANIAYTKLNYQRMARIFKTQILDHQIKNTIEQIRQKQDWWVITETWCGDAAQSLPIMAKLAALNPMIHLKIVFRDENPEWMNRYLTNGSRAIPKLVVMDALSEKELAVWGATAKGSTTIGG